VVIKKIQELLGLSSDVAEKADDVDDVQLAAAALLVEVATVDKNFDAAERARILAFVQERFALEEGIAGQLLAITAAIRQGLSYEDRVELMECLWHVAYADGEADPFEDQLMRRIGELIYVTDRDRGETRKKAIAERRGV